MNRNHLLSFPQILFFYFGFLVVYISGLFIPLMENDSAQHASMAMRMALNNNFLEIYKGDNPYLDKPQMHFWLAAISMKIFGINHIAYRIPALLCLILGAFSTKKLSDLLYENQNTGFVASLIFLSSQTIILSAHDVRTDAVLTGFIIFAIWKLIEFIKKGNVYAALLAGFGTALAFSTKGLMAVVIIGFCVFSYLIYSREWKKFFNLKIVIAVISFLIGILPVLYAYYHQFGDEGIRFILFNQSFNRLTANGFEETSPDYFFFFHTLLWAFLPFSLAFYFGIFEKSWFFVKSKFKKTKGVEFLTLGGFWLVMLLFSVSKFKLPHYLNGLIAVLSIFTAGYIFDVFEKKQFKKIKILYYIQVFVISVVTIAIGFLTFYFSGIRNVPMFGLYIIFTLFLFYKILTNDNLFSKYIFVSILFVVTVNIYLNTQFYPVLTEYQGSVKLAKFVNLNGIDKSKIYMPKDYEPWAFDFYTQRNTPRVDVRYLKSGSYLVVYKEDFLKLTRKYQIVDQENHYRITRLSLKFLNPKTRSEQFDKIYLIKILN